MIEHKPHSCNKCWAYETTDGFIWTCKIYVNEPKGPITAGEIWDKCKVTRIVAEEVGD